MGAYFGITIVVIAVIGLLCNCFYHKGYKDCYNDYTRNREFGKNVDSLKCYIVEGLKEDK